MLTQLQRPESMISLPASPLIKTHSDAQRPQRIRQPRAPHFRATADSHRGRRDPTLVGFSLSKANLTVFLPPVHDPRVHKANIYRFIYISYLPTDVLPSTVWIPIITYQSSIT